MSKLQEAYEKFDEYISERKSKLEDCLSDLESDVSTVQISDKDRELLEGKLRALSSEIENL